MIHSVHLGSSFSCRGDHLVGISKYFKLEGRRRFSSACTLLISHLSRCRDDDDINDVASMAGVNLNEESARILATNSELVGTQIRSCKDEAFLHPGLLHRRILETGKIRCSNVAAHKHLRVKCL